MCTINMCNINICISLLQVTHKHELYSKRTLHCRNVAIVNFEPCYTSTFTCSCSLMMCVNCCFIALEVVIPKDRTFSKEQLALCNTVITGKSQPSLPHWVISTQIFVLSFASATYSTCMWVDSHYSLLVTGEHYIRSANQLWQIKLGMTLPGRWYWMLWSGCWCKMINLVCFSNS